MLKVGPHITHSSVTRLRPRFGLAGLAGLLVALQFGCEQKADANGRADAGSAQGDAARGDSGSVGDGQRDGGQGNGAQDSGSSGSRDSGSRDAAGSDSDLPDAAEGERDASESGPQQKCVVFLHGKSGGGFATQTRAEYLFVAPTGNADGWGGRQWLYFPDDRLTETRQIIAQAIADNGCTKVLIHGFSNGGAAAAKLYCRGVTFDKKVVGYVVDDPVPDHGADGCKPPTGVKLRLYWTSALTPHNGWNCQEGDWTCEGGTTVGIQTYAANLGVPATKSAKTNHEPYNDPPEYQNWW